MPLNNPAPQFGLLTAQDVRDLSATKIFTRGATAVNMPTFSVGEGVYEDAVLLLNARESADDNSATGQLTTSKTFGSSWSATISADDKVTITSDVEFTLTKSGTDDPLGFGSSVVSSVLVGSDYVATAINDWERGALDLTNTTYTINEVGGSGSFTFPDVQLKIQDVTVLMRSRSTSDADDFGLKSIEQVDQEEMSSDSIAWSITDDGHALCHYLTSLGDITWNSDTMRDKLGFTGDETPTTSGGFSTLISTHKVEGVLIPSRPFQAHHLRVTNQSQARRLIGGGYVSNHIGSYITSVLRFDLDALLDADNDYKHFTNRWLPLASMGERVNFYQGWGDSRRSLRTAQTTASQDAYDLLYTSEDDGEYGRLRGSMITSELELTYPLGLRRRVPVTVEIEHV
jgi:hypothetical protein